MHLLSQVVIFLRFPFENIWINERKGNLTDDFAIGIHEEVFQVQILLYGRFTLKENQNQYSFLGKRITQRIKKKSCFSMRLNCLNEFRRNKIFSKIKSLIVLVLFALSDYAWDDKRPYFFILSLKEKVIQ